MSVTDRAEQPTGTRRAAIILCPAGRSTGSTATIANRTAWQAKPFATGRMAWLALNGSGA